MESPAHPIDKLKRCTDKDIALVKTAAIDFRSATERIKEDKFERVGNLKRLQLLIKGIAFLPEELADDQRSQVGNYLIAARIPPGLDMGSLLWDLRRWAWDDLVQRSKAISRWSEVTAIRLSQFLH